MKNKYDELDAAIVENLKKPRMLRYNNVQLGEQFGVSEATVRRHISKLDVDEFFGVPNSIITSRSKTVRLEDGSYEKITYSPSNAAAEDALKFDDVDKAIRNYMPKSVDNGTRAGTLVVCAADYQVGKTDQKGGTPELVERVMAVLDRWSRELPHYHTIVVADLGDVIENFFNVTQQAQTNDLSLTDQILVAQRLLLETILRLSEKCDELVYVAVPSNHCAVRTSKGSKGRANAPDDDYGLLVQDNIQIVAEHASMLSHVKFVRPNKWEEAVTVIAPDGTGIGFTHGDLAGSLGKMGQWFASMSHGHRGGLHDADILVHGHFHTPTVSMSGDCRWIVGAPSIDNGSAWYTNRSGNASPSAMLTFEALNHRVENWRLWQ